MNFEKILAEFGNVLETPLVPDDNGSCLINLDDELNVQIEPSNDHLLIGITLGQAPGGKSQERLFRAALMANDHSPPLYGTFAFSRRSGELILFSLLPSQGLTGEKLADHFYPMVAKAREWRTALQRGEIPQITPMEE